MIEKLKKKDIEEAAKVYNKSLSMEIPKGQCELNKLITLLDKKVKCFIHKTNNKIDGLISFEFIDQNKIKVDFIGVLKLRKGIGTKLMKKLVGYAYRKKVRDIYSNVSSKDKGAMKFYEHCGFQKYGEYHETKDFLLYKIKAKPKEILAALKK